MEGGTFSLLVIKESYAFASQVKLFQCRCSTFGFVNTDVEMATSCLFSVALRARLNASA